MKSNDRSRREFLGESLAALAAGGAMSTSAARVFGADAPAPSAESQHGQQGIACLRREAAEAGVEVLKSGGNAIDAAVAALMVLFVIEPKNVGLGGYGGSLVFYQAKTGRVFAIDHDARAPRKFDPATFNAASAFHGYLATGVPGNAAGLDLALSKFGTLPFKKLSKAAVDYAENGVPATARFAADFQALAKSLDATSRKAYFPSGAPKEGERWVQADLAKLIRRLGDDGLGSFYSSDIATTIVKQMQANGGALAKDDFHDFKATAVEPLHISYRGYDLYTPPPPSGGLTSLSILKTLEQFDVPKLEPWGADYVELFAGASNQCWKERFQYFGDPEFVKIPYEELLSESRAKERADALRKKQPTSTAAPADGSKHTVNLVVIDGERNIASWTATHGGDFGSHVAIDGLGLMLGHGMSRFDQPTNSPNYPAPRKRPQHNMAPLVVLRGGKPHAGLGLPGGRMIVTVTAQLAANLIDFKAGAKQIVSAPRIHTEGAEPIQVTAKTPAAAVEELRRRGHEVEMKEGVGGAANAMIITERSQNLDAADSNGPAGVMVF
jgi:gamma-glutamyltranspeptidase/glutathione hydrolase